MNAIVLLGPDKIVCNFENDDSCLFENDLDVNERWIVVKSEVRKWDNTLNVGLYFSTFLVHLLTNLIMRSENAVYVNTLEDSAITVSSIVAVSVL